MVPVEAQMAAAIIILLAVICATQELQQQLVAVDPTLGAVLAAAVAALPHAVRIGFRMVHVALQMVEPFAMLPM